MTTRVALVTGGSSGIGEETARRLRQAELRGVRRRPPRRPDGAPRGRGDPRLRDGRHRRRLDGERGRAGRRRAGADRRTRQQRGLRLLRRRRGRADRRGAPPVRGQRLRSRPAHPAGHAAHAPAGLGPDHQHLLDRREVLRAPRRLVPRDEVRGGGLQRQPPGRARAVRDRRRHHRARPDPHRVERDLPREPDRDLRRRGLRGAGREGAQGPRARRHQQADVEHGRHGREEDRRGGRRQHPPRALPRRQGCRHDRRARRLLPDAVFDYVVKGMYQR